RRPGPAAWRRNGCSRGRRSPRAACRKGRPRYNARHPRKGATAEPPRLLTSAGPRGPDAGVRPDCPEPSSRIRCSTCSFVLRQVKPILPRGGVQAFELQAITGRLAGVAEYAGQADAEQQTTGILLRKARETFQIVPRGHVVLAVVGQFGHGQQGQRPIGVQAQGALEVLHSQVFLLELQGRQAQILEHPRALGIEGVLAGLPVALIGLLVLLLLEQESAVV